jgi:hypothetical protein
MIKTIGQHIPAIREIRVPQIILDIPTESKVSSTNVYENAMIPHKI